MRRLLTALVALTLASAAAAAPLPASCGAEGAVCGKSLPGDSPCNANPGFCQPGLFCGTCTGNYGCNDTRSLCQRVPKGCGTVAVPDPHKSWDAPPEATCCPPNANRAFTSNTSEYMPPTCSNGLTCHFFTQGPWRNSPDDPYAANLFQNGIAGNCITVPNDCGAPGKACCPNAYHSGYEPEPRGWMCWGGKNYSTANYCDTKTNTCIPNASNCGRVGAPCCISDGGSTTNYGCEGNGPGFYCTGDKVPMCTKCPDGWETKFKEGSSEYAQCKY